MLNRSFLTKIVSMPVKRASRILTNILIFDLAMSVYHHVKMRFLFGRQEKKQKEEDVLNEDLLARLKERGR